MKAAMEIRETTLYVSHGKERVRNYRFAEGNTLREARDQDSEKKKKAYLKFHGQYSIGIIAGGGGD